MKIEIAKLSDAEEILHMLDKTPQVQTTEESSDYNLGFIRKVISNKKLHLCIIAKEKNELAGILIANFWPTIRESFTLDLVVNPKFRRRKIATKLNQRYEKILKKRNFKFISSFVLVKNIKMQNFQKKLNYKKGKKFYFYGKKLR